MRGDRSGTGAVKRRPGRADRRNHPAPRSVSSTLRRRVTAEPIAERRPRVRPGGVPPLTREVRAPRTGPQRLTAPADRTAAPKSTRQARARVKAWKAKAPKVVRPPLRERLIRRLAALDLRPHALIGKVPFVVLIIGILGVGLGLTLWLSTDAATRSYELGHIREQNRALMRQKEALDRDVRTAESAPALAEAARELGMIPSRDTAHLIQDPAGNWVVIGEAKPAEGVPLPPLNTKLPEAQPAPRAVTPASPPEIPVRLPANRPGLGPIPQRSWAPTPSFPQGGALTLPSVPVTGLAPAEPLAPAGALPDPAALPPPAALDPVAPPIDGVPIPPGPPAAAGVAEPAEPVLPPAFAPATAASPEAVSPPATTGSLPPVVPPGFGEPVPGAPR